jgi:uncharacterized protein GlcG (DUF336 family)
MSIITIAHANRIIAEAVAKAAALKLKPLGIAVLDPGGHVVAFQRQDGASTMRFQIAVGKAAGALGVGMSSRKIAEMAAERPTFVAALTTLAPSGLVPAAGGVIVVDGAGMILGAVGVSGDTSDNDEVCALAGIEAAGLKAKG